MAAILLLGTTLVAGPWCQPVTYVVCEPVPVYWQCTPAANALPAKTTVSAAVVEDVAAETVEAAATATDDPVTENVAGMTFDPASLTLRNLGLGHMALDWGVASIASGALTPTPAATFGGGGFFWPGGNRNSGGGSTVVPAVSANGNPIVLLNVGGTTIIPPPPQPVPEPASLLTWLGLIGVILLAHRHLRGRTLKVDQRASPAR